MRPILVGYTKPVEIFGNVSIRHLVPQPFSDLHAKFYRYRPRETAAFCTKSGSRNTIVTLDFRLEVEIWPFRASAMKKYAIQPLFMAEFPVPAQT